MACMPHLHSGSPVVSVLCALVIATAFPSGAQAADSTEKSIAARVEVSGRTALRVSADVLEFEVLDPAVPVAAAIEFSAGVRTQPGGEVLLIVEPLAVTHDSEGVDIVEEGVSRAAAGNAQDSDVVDLSTPGPRIVRRWSGGGLRHGTVRFTLRAPKPGRYTVPLRMVLSVP